MKIRKYQVIAAGIVLATTLLFQNCGSIFRAQTAGEPTSSNSTLPPSETPDVQYVSPFSKFVAGVLHFQGTYKFTNKNFLVEGADSILAMGGDAIGINLTAGYAGIYPEGTVPLWPATLTPFPGSGRTKATLTDLIQTEPYKQVLAKNFKTYIFWMLPISNSDPFGFNQTELKNEISELTAYLVKTYQGSGKTFIFSNWGSDSIILMRDWSIRHPNEPFNQAVALTEDASEETLSAVASWLNTVQAGVVAGRKTLPDAKGVWVLNSAGVECTMPAINSNIRTSANGLLPKLNVDMVTYTPKEGANSPAVSPTPEAVNNNLMLALYYIDRYAPDPQRLGKKRILVNMFWFEQRPNVSSQTMLPWGKALYDAAIAFGAAGAFVWNLHDNHCRDGVGHTVEIPYDQLPGITDPKRPYLSDCSGLSLVRPDGTKSILASYLKNQFWSPTPKNTVVWNEVNERIIQWASFYFLERTATNYQAALGQLNSGQITRIAYVNQIIDQSITEGHRLNIPAIDFVKFIYIVALGFPGDEDGIVFWSGSIDATPASRANVAKAMLAAATGSQPELFEILP